MKTNINIGVSVKRKVNIDLDILLRTRLLIQANSGGGKSWLLRRIAEQAFGKIQTIIIDPEGEFATLREKYGYVLVGKGGETPADVRSAALVAHKLLELHASAVCDLYEMKASQRHAWVRVFLEAIVDAPKKLWHPVLIIVDEAHNYAPEKGSGESEASDAMIGLATRGRKRGFCAIFATQRLGKLRKDAAAELTNVLIGQTFIDVDRKRASESLGIPRSEERKFFDEMKVVEPGNFWALGRAISKERILVQVGDVTTTHPEPGSSKHFLEPPPPPAKIKSLLPKLSDLPREAEQKARTEADLRAENASLKRQLATRTTVPVPVEAKTVTKTVEVPVFKKKDISAIKEAAREMNKAHVKIQSIYEAWGHNHQVIGERINTLLRALVDSKPMAMEKPVTPKLVKQLIKENSGIPRFLNPTLIGNHSRTHNTATGAMMLSATQTDTLSGPEQRIINAIAWIESLGYTDADQAAAASLAGYTVGGGAWNNPRGSLRTKGLLSYRGNRIALTEAGRSRAQAPDTPLTTKELHEKVMKILRGPEQKILRVLLDSYPEPVSNEELAAKAGYSMGGGAFANPRGRLRSLGLIDYPGAGLVVAKSLLFLEG